MGVGGKAAAARRETAGWHAAHGRSYDGMVHGCGTAHERSGRARRCACAACSRGSLPCLTRPGAPPPHAGRHRMTSSMVSMSSGPPPRTSSTRQAQPIQHVQSRPRWWQLAPPSSSDSCASPTSTTSPTSSAGGPEARRPAGLRRRRHGWRGAVGGVPFLLVLNHILGAGDPDGPRFLGFKT